jgi:hypothetical protein
MPGPPSQADECPNLVFAYSRLSHARTQVSTLPWDTTLCHTNSRWPPAVTADPVSCQKCLRMLAEQEVAAGQVTDRRGPCPICGDYALLTEAGTIAGHRQMTTARPWCRGAGSPPYQQPRRGDTGRQARASGST